MTPRIFVYVEHKGGIVEESVAELLGAAQKIDAQASPTAILAGFGAEVETACGSVSSLYGEIWKINHESLGHPNPEMVRQALVTILPRNSILLLLHDHFGIDLSPGLSVKLNSAFVPDVLAIEPTQGETLRLVRQEFGGQVSAHVSCDVSMGAVISIRPGAFDVGQTSAAPGVIVDKSSEVGVLTARRRFIETIAAEAGDVDITKHNVLVSIGRGIQEKDNTAIAEELAEVLGAAVSCSRPVVDAKWMEKSRQVGSSGKTVKPKVYLACGISGAFQHLAGVKGNPFIIAINKNPKAPIFQVADIGIVDDILEFFPELIRKVRESRGIAA